MSVQSIHGSRHAESKIQIPAGILEYSWRSFLAHMNNLTINLIQAESYGACNVTTEICTGLGSVNPLDLWNSHTRFQSPVGCYIIQSKGAMCRKTSRNLSNKRILPRYCANRTESGGRQYSISGKLNRNIIFASFLYIIFRKYNKKIT